MQFKMVTWETKIFSKLKKIYDMTTEKKNSMEGAEKKEN